MRWILAYELYRSIGHQKGRGITFFHAFTGCDVVSAFRGKGKKSAWQTWDMCAEASDVFARLSHYPPTVNDNEMDILEKCVVIMYDRSNPATVCSEAETIPSHFTSWNRFTSARQAGCLSGRLRMERINTAPTRNTEPC